MTITTQKLSKLRELLEKETLDGYLQPLSDEWQSHFVPEHANRLKWLTGFTGSAGFAVILQNKAAFFSDSRYAIQMKEELDTDVFEICDMSQTPPEKWIEENAVPGSVIGYDPALLSISEREKFEKKLSSHEISLHPVPHNPVDRLWTDKPSAPALKPVRVFPEEIAGASAGEKLSKLCTVLDRQDLDFYIFTSTTSLCWMLNVRGEDVPNLPTVLSYGILDVSEKIINWFVPEERLTNVPENFFAGAVEIKKPDQFKSYLKTLSGRAGIDKSAPDLYYNLLEESNAEVVFLKDPVVALRWIKTTPEIKAMRDVHILDGAAVCKTLYWLEQQKGEPLKEGDIAQAFETFRAFENTYLGSSFNPIIGSAGNGAIVHYGLKNGHGADVQKNNMLLMDTGGQYLTGTTDITRTIFFGEEGAPTDQMKKHFTLVLKGHIAVSTAKFPIGTTGAQIDILARQALWAEGLDYGHGTGHGVGVSLDVHEESANIHPRAQTPLEAGMILTNEPGYYLEGAYGIRIENILVVKDTGQKTDTGKILLAFEPLTLAPIDKRLIDKNLLSGQDIDWLNAYHKEVYSRLSSKLEVTEADWLKHQTSPI
jgi:Xaa-Pro aminopeptidase